MFTAYLYNSTSYEQNMMQLFKPWPVFKLLCVSELYRIVILSSGFKMEGSHMFTNLK